MQLEAHEQELEKKLEQNEVDFGVKRAKFRELFLQKEGIFFVYCCHLSEVAIICI